MSDLQVEIPELRQFGHEFETFGSDHVGNTGEATRCQTGRASSSMWSSVRPPVPRRP
jgi:hypothetical protein